MSNTTSQPSRRHVAGALRYLVGTCALALAIGTGSPPAAASAGPAAIPAGGHGACATYRAKMLAGAINRNTPPCAMTATDLELLRAVSRYVYNHFTFVDDAANDTLPAPAPEYWNQLRRVGERMHGDCEDFAMYARALVEQLGYRARLVEVFVPDGRRNLLGRHIVLEVEGYLIDNLQPAGAIVANTATDYKFTLVSDYLPTGKWFFVDGVEPSAEWGDETLAATAQAEP